MLGQHCGHDSCAISALRGFRNGVEYATRIRVAHCLVMVLLYRRHHSLRANVQFIFNATREHALNLGGFVLLFKLLRCTLRNKASVPLGPASFIAGGLSGAVVWGRSRTAINYQVVLYLLSRISVGAIHHHVNLGALPDVPAFRPLAGLVWAVVMYLFTIDPASLQGSLRSSMEFLYNNEVKKGLGGPIWIPSAISPFIPFSGV